MTTFVRTNVPMPAQSRKAKSLKYPDPVVGTAFTRLTVISAFSSNGHDRVALVRCTCGVEKVVYKSGLMSGDVQSCGCLRKAVSKSVHTKHGASGTVEHSLWMAMVARCECPTNRQYASYGARGILVSEDWKTFEGFYADMGDRPFAGATLERVNNDGNYEKSNVVWADRTTQANNRRSSVRWEYKGEKYTLKDLAALSGLNRKMLEARLYLHNWSVERAVETPVTPPSELNKTPASTTPATRHKLYPQP